MSKIGLWHLFLNSKTYYEIKIKSLKTLSFITFTTFVVVIGSLFVVCLKYELNK